MKDQSLGLKLRGKSLRMKIERRDIMSHRNTDTTNIVKMYYVNVDKNGFKAYF